MDIKKRNNLKNFLEIKTTSTKKLNIPNATNHSQQYFFKVEFFWQVSYPLFPDFMNGSQLISWSSFLPSGLVKTYNSRYFYEYHHKHYCKEYTLTRYSSNSFQLEPKTRGSSSLVTFIICFPSTSENSRSNELCTSIIHAHAYLVTP